MEKVTELYFIALHGKHGMDGSPKVEACEGVRLPVLNALLSSTLTHAVLHLEMSPKQVQVSGCNSLDEHED